MSVQLTRLQKQLCNALQDGLPICQKPYADLAEFLGSDEKTVLQEIKRLKETGVIRRISVLINSRSLGMASTLVAAHVPAEILREVTGAVNGKENVSHNYLRTHHYNLWFTLQARSVEQIEAVISNLSGRFGIKFYSMPVKRIFKLDVRFDAEGEGQRLSSIEQIPNGEAAELNDKEKQILSGLENKLEVISEPFDFLRGDGLETGDVLRIIQGLIDKGAVRRIAAVVDQRKLGFVENILFCSKVPESRIIEAGEALARVEMVSHCYERETVEDWPYNLFAMMHGRSMGEIQRAISEFAEAEKVDSFELLPTAAELKKEPVKHRFN